MNKEASTISTIKNLAKETSKLGANSKSLAKAMKAKDFSKAKSLGKNVAKGMALPGAATLGAAGAVALSGEKGKNRRDKAKRIVTDNLIPSAKASMGQKALAGIGAGLGTAVQMKRGKSFGDAAKTGGLAGMAIGDTLGSVAIPQGRFIAMHKKEFGTMPSAKDMGKLFAVNTVPTAATWGAIMSLKKPRKFYQNNTKEMVEGLVNKGKGAKDALKFSASPEAAKMGNAEFLREFKNKAKGPQTNKNLGKTVAKAMVVDNIVDQVVDFPTKFVTPESLIRQKKEREKMNKTAFDVVNESFEKIAEDFSQEEKSKIKEIKRDLRTARRTRGMSVKDRFKDFGKAALISSVAGTAGSAIGGAVGKRKGAMGAILGPQIGQTAGAVAATVPYAMKVSKQREVAKDNVVMSHGGDLSKLKTRNKGRAYNRFTNSGLAKDIVRQNRQKTACEIVSELLDK